MRSEIQVAKSVSHASRKAAIVYTCLLYTSIQTPQIFSYDLIRGAYESIRKKDMTGVTDDAMVVEQETGTKILLVEGSYQNIKITTPEDLAIAEAFLRY